MKLTVDIEVPEGKFCGDNISYKCEFLTYGGCSIFKVKSLKYDYIIRNHVKELFKLKCNECLIKKEN